MTDRCQRRLFSSGTLKASKFAEISQKLMSATAARYALVWLASLMRDVGAWPGLDASYKWAATLCIALADIEAAFLRNGSPDRAVGKHLFRLSGFGGFLFFQSLFETTSCLFPSSVGELACMSITSHQAICVRGGLPHGEGQLSFV